MRNSRLKIRLFSLRNGLGGIKGARCGPDGESFCGSCGAICGSRGSRGGLCGSYCGSSRFVAVRTVANLGRMGLSIIKVDSSYPFPSVCSPRSEPPKNPYVSSLFVSLVWLLLCLNRQHATEPELSVLRSLSLLNF